LTAICPLQLKGVWQILEKPGKAFNENFLRKGVTLAAIPLKNRRVFRYLPKNYAALQKLDELAFLKKEKMLWKMGKSPLINP